MLFATIPFEPITVVSRRNKANSFRYLSILFRPHQIHTGFSSRETLLRHWLNLSTDLTVWIWWSRGVPPPGPEYRITSAFMLIVPKDKTCIQSLKMIRKAFLPISQYNLLICTIYEYLLYLCNSFAWYCAWVRYINTVHKQVHKEKRTRFSIYNRKLFQPANLAISKKINTYHGLQ